MPKYGIELENWVTDNGKDYDWDTDGSGCDEIRSDPCSEFKDILKFTKEHVTKTYEDMWFHSFPSGKGGSISAHIHRSPTSYRLHDTLFKLCNIYQFFFKNSPRSFAGKQLISYRHVRSTWCDMVRIDEPCYDNFNRMYLALTPNDGCDTIEFRYNDYPKSLNQITLYYYINRIAEHIVKLKDNHFNFKLLRIDQMNDLDKRIHNGIFSFTQPHSTLLFNAKYKDLLVYFSKDIEIMFSKWQFYDFYKEKYTNFTNLIKSMYNYETKMYQTFFDEHWSCVQWSDFWKSRFLKDLPRGDLIKTGG